MQCQLWLAVKGTEFSSRRVKAEHWGNYVTHLFWTSSLGRQQIHHILSWRCGGGKLHLLDEEAAGAHPPAPSWLQAHRAAPQACTCPASSCWPCRTSSAPERDTFPLCQGSQQPLQQPILIPSDTSAPSCCQQQNQAQGHKLSTEQLMELLLFEISDVKGIAGSTGLHGRVAVGKGSSHHLNYGQTAPNQCQPPMKM